MNQTVIVFVVSFVAFLGPFSQAIYTPILFEVAQQFHSGQLLVNSSLSIYTFILAVMQIVYGPLADAWGRRNVLIPGIILYVLATLGCAYADSIVSFLFFRGMQAAGIACGSVVAVAIIGDICRGKKLGSAMGTYQMLVSLGPVLGPVIGGLMWGIAGYHGIVLLLTGVGSVALIVNLLFVRETKRVANQENRFKLAVVKEIIRHPIGASIISLGFIQFYMFFTLLVFLPQILGEQYGLTATEKGLVFLPLSACIVIGSYFGGRSVEKVKVHNFLVVVASLNVVAILLSYLSVMLSFVLVIVCSALFGLFLGLSLPVQTTLLSRTFMHQRATAVGIYNFFRFIGIAISPIVGGIIFPRGGGPLLFGCVALAFACCVWFMKTKFAVAQKSSVEI